MGQMWCQVQLPAKASETVRKDRDSKKPCLKASPVEYGKRLLLQSPIVIARTCVMLIIHRCARHTYSTAEANTKKADGWRC